MAGLFGRAIMGDFWSTTPAPLEASGICHSRPENDRLRRRASRLILGSFQTQPASAPSDGADLTDQGQAARGFPFARLGSGERSLVRSQEGDWTPSPAAAERTLSHRTPRGSGAV